MKASQQKTKYKKHKSVAMRKKNLALSKHTVNVFE